MSRHQHLYEYKKGRIVWECETCGEAPPASVNIRQDRWTCTCGNNGAGGPITKITVPKQNNIGTKT